MSASRQEILLEAAGMEPGERARIVCPTCQGGSTREKSLSISIQDDGTPTWNCFRAGCTERGASGRRGSFVRTRHTPKQTSVKPYTKELRFCEDDELAVLTKEIGWTEKHFEHGRPFYAPEDRRYAFPIRGPMAEKRGYVLRSYEGAKPKALTRMEVEAPHMSWYNFRKDSHVVVVEDIPSAVRASLYLPAVALCGTGVNLDYAAEIAAHYRHVLWALDADATRLAIEIRREHSLLFETSHIIVLEQDIKDMEEDEVRQLLESWQDES